MVGNHMRILTYPKLLLVIVIGENQTICSDNYIDYEGL